MTRRSLLELAVSAPVLARERPPASAPWEPAFERARTLPRLTSLAVYVDDRLVRESFQNGLQDGDQPTNVKSISKSLLSLLIGIAIDRGHIRSVRDRLSRYLPRLFTRERGLDHLTVYHLLTMTADLVPTSGPNYDDWASSPDWVEYILARGRVGTLGQFRYTTGDTHLLAVLLSHATDMNALDFADKYLFCPLGIEDVRWETDPVGYHRGGNDMYLSTHALARIGALVLHQGRYRGKQIVSRAFIRAATRRQVAVSDAEADPKGGLALDGYGYLWWTMRLGGHDAALGWGFGRQYLIVVPAVRTVVVLTSHYGDMPPPEHHRAVASLIDPVIGEGVLALRARR